MFGGGDGEWDETWMGWYGEDPPYHVPVFVLTHHPREPLTMQGGTTFTFVTDGIESALEQARTAAGEEGIAIAGSRRSLANRRPRGQHSRGYTSAGAARPPGPHLNRCTWRSDLCIRVSRQRVPALAFAQKEKPQAA
jgi:hypothetical protein